MKLADEYRRQFAWRDWPRILEVLPSLKGSRVLDVGCGPGDLSAALAARGAFVVGVDMNDDLLAAARAKLPSGRFVSADLRQPLVLRETFDGVWGSFSAAYFPDLAPALRNWTRGLKAGGWLALTEIDDLFAHRPLPDAVRARFETYADEALATGRYDFRMGRKLERFVREAGLEVVKSFTVADRELSFEGPADSEVITAWRARLERMQLLRDVCGSEFPAVREEFLQTLGRDDHHSDATVRVVLGRAVMTPSAPTTSSSS